MVVCGNQTQSFSFTLFRLFLFFPRVCDIERESREEEDFSPHVMIDDFPSWAPRAGSCGHFFVCLTDRMEGSAWLL